MKEKTALQSKTIKFNLALGSTSIVMILSYILDVLKNDGFNARLLEFLAVLGVDANAVLVSSIVGFVISVISIYLRIKTEAKIVSIK